LCKGLQEGLQQEGLQQGWKVLCKEPQGLEAMKNWEQKSQPRRAVLSQQARAGTLKQSLYAHQKEMINRTCCGELVRVSGGRMMR